MKHTISVLVENKFGVLARVAGLFSARGYNISSLAVSETQDEAVSYMTIVVNAEDEKVLEQIKKQLNKLIDVISVTDFTRKDYIARELILIKIEAKDKIKDIVIKYPAKIIEAKKDYFVIEIMGDENQIKNFMNDIGDFKVIELVKTGKIAMES
ncbi:MAG: acetolactate synthase small subunit [Candidatus Omnitrophota bacterium]